jgi:hypothetical protein
VVVGAVLTLLGVAVLVVIEQITLLLAQLLHPNFLAVAHLLSLLLPQLLELLIQ